MTTAIEQSGTLERDLSISLGRFAGVVSEIERTRPKGFDPIRSESGRVMAAMLRLADLMKLRPDPASVGALGEVLDRRPVLDGMYMGANHTNLILRVFDPWERLYRWHEIAIGSDVSVPLFFHGDRVSQSSPMRNGFYLKLSPQQQRAIAAHSASVD